MEGVVRMPSAFSITFGVLPSITATHELVVPRSMPMTLPMSRFLLSAAGRPVLPAPEREIPRGPRAPLIRPPKNHMDAAPKRRLGSYRRAGLGRKIYDHGFATGGRARRRSPAKDGSNRRACRFDKVQRLRTMTAMTAASALSGLRLVPGYLNRASQEALLGALGTVFAAAPL